LVSFANKAVKQTAVSRHARGVLVDGSIIPVQVDLSGFVSIYTERLKIITDECKQNFHDLNVTITVFLEKEQEFRDKQREFRDKMKQWEREKANLTEQLRVTKEELRVSKEECQEEKAKLNATIQQKDEESSRKDEELRKKDEELKACLNKTMGAEAKELLEEKEKEIKECEGKVSNMTKVIEVKIPELEGKVVDCREKCEGKLQNLTDATDQKVAKLREKLEECKGKEKNCSKEKDRLKEEIKGVGDQLKKCETEAGQLKEKIGNMTEEIATKDEHLEEKKEKLKKCKTEKTACKKELDICNEMNDNCTEKIEQLRKEIERLKKFAGESETPKYPMPWEFVPDDALDTVVFSGRKPPILVQSHDLNDPKAFYNASYDDYKRGFSRSPSEYWIGLDALVNITKLENGEPCPGTEASNWNWLMMFWFESRKKWGWIEFPRSYVTYNEEKQRYEFRAKHRGKKKNNDIRFSNLEVGGQEIALKDAKAFLKHFADRVDCARPKVDATVQKVFFYHPDLPVRTEPEEDCDFEYDLEKECSLEGEDDRKCAKRMGGGWFFQDTRLDSDEKHLACEFCPNCPLARNGTHLMGHLSSRGPDDPLLWDESDPPTKTLIVLRPRPSKEYCRDAFGCYGSLK